MAAVRGDRVRLTFAVAAPWGGLGAGARELEMERVCGQDPQLQALAQPHGGGAAGQPPTGILAGLAAREAAALCAGAIDSGSQRKWNQ